GEARQEMDHPGGHGVDVAGCPGDGLGDHSPLPVEDARGEVAGLADDGREGRAHERRGLLVDGGDEPAPEDVEGDLVHGRSAGRRVYPTGGTSTITFEASSTRIRAAALTTTVDSRSSMIAGPSSVAPPPSA